MSADAVLNSVFEWTMVSLLTLAMAGIVLGFAGVVAVSLWKGMRVLIEGDAPKPARPWRGKAA